MASLPAKVATRIASGLKRFQPILDSARARDANESDTVIIVMDLLSEILGYDKYSEITSEHAIRGTFCDLAIKIDGGLALLIEVKAIGLELRDQHVSRQLTTLRTKAANGSPSRMASFGGHTRSASRNPSSMSSWSSSTSPS